MALAIATLGSALISAGTAYVQNQEAKKLARGNNRPTRETSPYLKKALGGLEFDAAAGGYAGQSQDERRADRSTAAAYRNIRESGMSPAAMIAGFAGVDYNRQQVNENMARQAAQRQERAKELYRSGLQVADQDYQTNWDYNQRQKYNENAAAISALNNSALSNLNNAFTGLGNAGIAYFGEGGLVGRPESYPYPPDRTGGNRQANPGINPSGPVSPSYTPPAYNPGDVRLQPPMDPMAVKIDGLMGPRRNMGINPGAYDATAYREQIESIYGPLDDNFFNYLLSST